MDLEPEMPPECSACFSVLRPLCKVHAQPGAARADTQWCPVAARPAPPAGQAGSRITRLQSRMIQP